MDTNNYEFDNTKSPDVIMKSCMYCTHRKVCAMYDALMDAVIIIDSFNETHPGYDDILLEDLAENCRQFNW